MNPLAAPLLAQSDSAKLGAGAVSLVVLLLMGVATAFLVWHMNGRLKRLPSAFPAPDDVRDPDDAASQPPTGPAGGATSGHPGGTA